MRYKSRSRALAASALAATVGLAGLGLVAPAAGAAPAETDRIAGVNRYETAADIAQLALPNADTVVLTTGEKLPDALSANPIAGAEDAPILLTLPASIPTFTQQALDAIDPTNVIIVGGTSAVSTAVENELEADGFTVTREAGIDRFETAAEVAREVGVAPDIDADGTGGEPALATVAIANGLTGLPDAVAASPMLHQMDIPLLLTGPDTLNEDAAAAIEDLGAEQALLLGGTAAISLAIEQGLEADGVNAERLAGTDRWGTAAAIADFEIDRLGFDAATTYIASGFSLADALAGGPLASVTNSPIVLVAETSAPAPTARWIEDNAADIDEIIALGGTAVINDTVLAEAAELADEGDAGQVTVTTASVVQGGTISGTITGDASSATVSGCGLTNEPVQDQNLNTAGIQFTEVLPQGQAAGNCTLTFTITRADGTTVTETETIAVTQRAGQNTATIRPELTSASIVGTTTATQAGPGNPAGTTVRYVFDEPVVNGTLGAAGTFLAYTADGTQAAGDIRVFDPAATNSVLVTFTDGAAPLNLQTATGAGQLTVATVTAGAVSDGTNPNPVGDAPLGTGTNQTVTRSAGVTAAPDLTGVSGFRSAFQPATATPAVAVDFAFDEAAFLVGNEDPTVAGDAIANDFALILADNTQVACEAPSNGSTLPASGLAVPGGQGTMTITVICSTTTGALSGNPAVRGVVFGNTVGDNDPSDGAQTNPLQTADINAGGNTSAIVNAPDLVSVQFFNGTGVAVDQALFTFDTNVGAAPVAASFCVYDNSANTDCAATATRNPSNASQVIVNLAAGTTADDAVGGFVADSAVSSALSAAANQEDEVGGTPLNPTVTATGTPGFTDGPDLTDVRLTAVRDIAGNLNAAAATFVFDEDIDQAGPFVPGNFVLLLADGTAVPCTAVGATGGTFTEDNDNTLSCTFAGLVPATQALNAVAGTVLAGSVDDEDTGVDNVGVNNNPEGYQVVSAGSTGTPRVS